ncbi:plasmid mobilization protein [Lacticaseibacillus paracasei]|uniref:plasmid mobilization protein n=1 Tax=Lacticaseibacillus paracasei TaxID=1597 RepID=UPI0037038DA5
MNFRLAPDQYETLRKSVAPLGMSVSAYTKSLAVKAKLRESQFSHEETINLAFHRPGNNLKQLPYYAKASDLRANLNDLPILKRR